MSPEDPTIDLSSLHEAAALIETREASVAEVEQKLAAARSEAEQAGADDGSRTAEDLARHRRQIADASAEQIDAFEIELGRKRAALTEAQGARDALIRELRGRVIESLYQAAERHEERALELVGGLFSEGGRFASIATRYDVRGMVREADGVEDHRRIGQALQRLAIVKPSDSDRAAALIEQAAELLSQPEPAEQ